ncbi:MAG: HAD family hydrolase [Candidatus Omnitrophota bacterium]
MAKKIEAVIFDLGNVLIDFDHTIAAEKVSSYCDKSPKEIYDYFFDSELTGLFEEGKIAPEDFFIEVKKILNLDLDYKKFLPVWNEIFFLSEKNRLVYETAKKLKNHYKVALLSNINVLHYNYIAAKFPLFDAFHTILLSFELKLKKPDPLIYKKALELLNVPAENVFYTDDREELIEESLRQGINGFVFKGFDQLKSDLSASGIII